MKTVCIQYKYKERKTTLYLYGLMSNICKSLPVSVSKANICHETNKYISFSPYSIQYTSNKIICEVHPFLDEIVISDNLSKLKLTGCHFTPILF